MKPAAHQRPLKIHSAGLPSSQRTHRSTHHRLNSASVHPAAVSPDALDPQLLYQQDEAALHSFVGSVQAARLAGDLGRGLETMQTVAAGQLLLVSTPLAVVLEDVYEEDDEQEEQEEQAEEGDAADEELVTDAEIQELQHQLLSSSDCLRTKEWLDVLDNGTPERLSQLPDLRQLSHLGAGPSGNSSSSTATHKDEAAEQQAADVLDLNLHVAASEDVPLSLVMGVQPRRAIGLWPEHALLNHSCSPNVAKFVYKARLFVHAARAVGKQGQLVTSYLPGSELLAPLAARQSTLQENHGFDCRCPRCKDEERQDANLRQLVEDIYEAATQQLGPDLALALEQGDEEGLVTVRDQLRMYVEVLDAAFTKLGVRQQSQIWIQASVFPLYELLAGALSALGETDARLLELLTALAASVEPGGEQHLYWSRQFRAEVEAADGREDDAFRHADKLCFEAHVARYGIGLGRTLYGHLLTAASYAEEGDDGEEDEEGV